MERQVNSSLSYAAAHCVVVAVSPGMLAMYRMNTELGMSMMFLAASEQVATDWMAGIFSQSIRMACGRTRARLSEW